MTCDIHNDSDVSRTFGVGAEIKDGGTIKADLGTRTTSIISPGSSASVTFTYTIPTEWTAKDYTLHAAVWSGTPGSSMWLDDDNRTFTVVAQTTAATITVQAISSVVQGNQVSVTCDIRNDSNVSRTFGVGAEIKDGSTIKADLGTRTTSSISPGSSASVTFTYTIPTEWTAKDYTLHAIVWSGTPGSSTWLDDDNRTFTVTATPLDLQGRIAYHSYSAYLASPVDSVDGNVFVYDFTTTNNQRLTGSLGVQNAMNPHFSPDGSRITFMAIPDSASRAYSSLEIYVYDLAEAQLVRLTQDSIADEDPKFAPNGGTIVFKRNGQVWTMSTDGSDGQQVTTTADEKSGPNYSPDGSRIVYWSDAGSSADIWWMNADGSNPVKILGVADLQEYYPLFHDSNRILYTRWESASDPHDKVYEYSISTTQNERLQLNVTGVEDSDPFPITSTLIGFSSQRSGGKGGWDVYVGQSSNATYYAISQINSRHHDLGGAYSPYRYARKTAVASPANGASLEASSSYLLSVRAYSDGGVWTGANPSVTLSGPEAQTYPGLRDDGTVGDQTAGDGVYSRTVTLPSTSGTYSITANAISSDNGLENNLISESVNITLYPPAPSAPTGVSATDGTYTDRVRVTWNGESGATSYEVWRHTSSNSSSASNVSSPDPTGTTYDDTAAVPGTTYYYWVKAKNTGGVSPFSSSDSGWRALSPPDGVSATDGTYTNRVWITWNSVTGASHYRVYRHTSDDSSGASASGDWETSTSYDDYDAIPSQIYYYWVKAAVNGAGADASGFSSSDAGFRKADPRLSVSPETRNVSSTSDGTSFDISNAGSGTMPWTAQVISGGSWLSISSEASGTNSGTITVSYTQNTGVNSRTGTVRVTAPDANDSPKDVTVTQSGACTLTASVVGGHGTVSPTSQTYNYGQVASLLATPDDTGYRVKSWSGTDNDASTATTNAVTMTSNKTVTVQFEAVPPPTLTIETADSIDPADANDQVTYTITYGNTGQQDASNTMIAEILPAGVSFVSASGGGVYNASTRTITWNIGTLASETTGQTVSFVVKVDGIMAEGGTITHNQLTIDCDQTGPVTAAAETTTVRDTKPPQISGCTPAADAEMAACGGMIRLHTTDGGSGVRYDGGTVTITIEGVLIYDGAHETSSGVYDTRSGNWAVKGVCRRTGTSADYVFSFTPSTRFDHEQSVDVVVTVADTAGNTGTRSYSFSTETRFFGKNAKVNSDTGTLIQDHSATAVDSAGNIWVVWDQQTAAGDTDIYIGKLAAAGTAFGASAAVYTGANVQSYPVVAVDRSDGLYVAWQSQGANGNWDVYVSRSTNGTTWTAPIAVNVGDPNNTSDQRYPSIAADSRAPGTVYVAYDDYRAGNWDIWVATSINGTVWTETRITTDPTDETLPRVFIDPNDSAAYVLWADARNAATQGTDIYAASSEDSWNHIAVVASTSNETSAVGTAYDTIYLAWVSHKSTPPSVYYGSDTGGLPVTGTGIADETGVSQASPSLALRHDARGTKLFAAWRDGRDVRNNSDTDVYFAESGSPFGTNILVNDDTGTSAQTAPAVGVDHKGNPYVVWVDERNGNKDVYFAGAVGIGEPMPTTVVTSGNKTTVTATAQANLEVEIPQMPSGVQADEITIAEVSNPPQMPSGTGEVGLKYEFAPTGLQFATPVTIRIPVAEGGGYTTYRVYRYDPNDLTSPSFPWTESGIHNPATKVTGVGGTYLEVQVDHFSIYGAAGVTVPLPGGGGGGGGGGCALSPYGGCGPVEFMLPVVMYVLVWVGMTLARRRRHCK